MSPFPKVSVLETGKLWSCLNARSEHRDLFYNKNVKVWTQTDRQTDRQTVGVTLIITWDNPNGNVHLVDGIGEGGGDGSQADEEASDHHHWTIAEAVAQQRGQGGWGFEGGNQLKYFQLVQVWTAWHLFRICFLWQTKSLDIETHDAQLLPAVFFLLGLFMLVHFQLLLWFKL